MCNFDELSVRSAPAAVPVLRSQIDPRDALLQAQCPVVPLPQFGSLAPMAANGQRLLVGTEGVWLQWKTAWLDWCEQIAHFQPSPVLPFAPAPPHLRAIRLPDNFRSLLMEFARHGREAFPNELGGALLYNVAEHTLRLVVHHSDVSRPDFLAYRMDPSGPGEVLAVDLHTHGAHDAYFSPVDDNDDRGTKLAVVLGRLADPVPTCAARLCLNGMFVPLPTPKGFGHPDPR